MKLQRLVFDAANVKPREFRLFIHGVFKDGGPCGTWIEELIGGQWTYQHTVMSAKAAEEYINSINGIISERWPASDRGFTHLVTDD
jgi:hypothetical protein